ncbi:MAG: response regulator [Chloroflexi bacterium]|nr:response regulator [Chloroflexota bacterium]
MSQDNNRADQPARILVVDDEKSMRDLLEQILVPEGYEVTTAEGGRAALTLLHKQRFDLILTDIVMPDIDGTEVLQGAKEIDPNVAVVVITGYPSADTAVRLIGMGAAEYVTKPFNVDVIQVTVAKVLALNRPAAAGPAGPSSAAAVDGATEVFNATLLIQSLKTELARSKWRGHVCSLLVAEIDHFESYTLGDGDDAGEGVLKSLVGALKGEMRPGDIIGRVGRAEFAVILPETTREEVSAVAERLRLANLAASIGRSSFPDDGGDHETLLRVARAAAEAGG